MAENYYTWGEGCEAWKLKDTEALSVIREKMPPGTSEKLHYHERSEQLFYIIKGKATFLVNDKTVELEANENLLIHPSVSHKIMNNSDMSLEFLVISQPRAHGDRIEI